MPSKKGSRPLANETSSKKATLEKTAPSTEETPEKKPKPRLGMTKRAGLIIPAGRVGRLLRKSCRGYRIGVGASVCMAAVIEYLLAELFELAANAARDHKKQRIQPRHIMLAIRYDDELSVLFRDVVFPQAGVKPAINGALLPKRAAVEQRDVDEEMVVGSSPTNDQEGAVASQEF